MPDLTAFDITRMILVRPIAASKNPIIIARTLLPFIIMITLTVPISTWDIIAIKTTADQNMMLTSKLNIK
jgi:hypothetical protein